MFPYFQPNNQYSREAGPQILKSMNQALVITTDCKEMPAWDNLLNLAEQATRLLFPLP